MDEYGYETQYDGRTKGWRLIEREFDTQELQLLIDSVQASRFITQKKAKELTDKLKKKASRFDRVLLDRRCYVPNRIRSINNSVFYHLDDLHTAIANDWQITFKYFYFTPKKQKAYYKKGELCQRNSRDVLTHTKREEVVQTSSLLCYLVKRCTNL